LPVLSHSEAKPRAQNRETHRSDCAPRRAAQAAKPWINRLALKRPHCEHAFMDPPQRCASGETFQCLVTQRKLTKREITFASDSP